MENYGFQAEEEQQRAHSRAPNFTPSGGIYLPNGTPAHAPASPYNYYPPQVSHLHPGAKTKGAEGVVVVDPAPVRVRVPLKGGSPPTVEGGEGEGGADSDSDTIQFEDLDWQPNSPVSKGLHAVHTYLGAAGAKHGHLIKNSVLCAIFVGYNAYFVGTVIRNRALEQEIEWCEGVGFLIVLTAIVYWGLFYYLVLKKYAGAAIYEHVLAPSGRTYERVWRNPFVRAAFFLTILGGLLTFLILDTRTNRRRLMSAAGVPILLLCGLIISKHPARVVWRHIIWGTTLQFLFGLTILRWQLGADSLQCVSSKMEKFLSYSADGASFVYGFTSTGLTLPGGVEIPGTFAFGVLPVIFYFSFIVAMLYHLGAMTAAVSKIGWLLQISVGTTAAESMNAAANIFLGQTEAPLVVKPFLSEMTNSELHAVMTGGFATIAGTVMGAFIAFGVSASHLLSASFMSAPAALALAKLIHPETKVSRTTSDKIYELTNSGSSKRSNFLDAASEGASQAVHLVANIIASLIAVVAFVALLNALLAWFGTLIGFDDFSFHWLLSKLFYPFAFIIGIDPEELDDVAYLLGLKTVVNEFVAYQRLVEMKHLSPRTKVITTYALCCFANFSSIGVQLGGLGALAPRRRKDMAKTIWRAFIAGNFAALMTACIAGTLTDELGYSDMIKAQQYGGGANLTLTQTVANLF